MGKGNPVWKPLREALQRLQISDRSARFWLRDDDATGPTAALDRLLAICERSQVPVVLAVIPEPTGKPLAERLKEAEGVSVAVHGWAHRNHAAPGEKKQELGPHRSSEAVLAELREGLAKLEGLHGDRAIPMLVPPWNRIDPDLLPALGGIGFGALSAFGPARRAPIRMVNSNVDLMDWHGTRGCLDHAVLIEAIVARLDTDEPIGILAHHLVHDEAAWTFLETLFPLTRSFGAEWLSGKQLVRGPA